MSKLYKRSMDLIAARPTAFDFTSRIIYYWLPVSVIYTVWLQVVRLVQSELE
jgi:hypothetical protein